MLLAGRNFAWIVEPTSKEALWLGLGKTLKPNLAAAIGAAAQGYLSGGVCRSGEARVLILTDLMPLSAK
jgi:hypothetical protein